MKLHIRIAALFVTAGAAAFGALIFVPPRLTPASALASPVSVAGRVDPIDGRYATTLADCAACHTVDPKRPFAGGRAIAAPMGTIYATNITPDKRAGIGSWTLDEFRAALVDGVAKGGRRLYPAMPYDNYRQLSETDIEAIYAYLMRDVRPDPEPGPQTRLIFPFNQRWGMRLWNWVSLDRPGFRPTRQDPQLRRGEYLVEGPGHCGACHTPRTLFMAQQATDASDARFLSGGEIGGWTAPGLRGPNSAPQRWSAAELKAYLTTGRNTQAAAGGEMALAIGHSLQYLEPSDADALVAYLRAIGGGGGGSRTSAPEGITASRIDRGRSDPTTRMLTSASPHMPDAARTYLDNCAACHSADGRGADGVFPALAGNDTVTAASPAGLIDTILHGATMPSTQGRPEQLRMPGFGERLDDRRVAALATFLRSAWGNAAGPVTARDVAGRRSSLSR
jgi:alcohol dehydrogenase (quinone), cytochrome c subunit